LKSWNLSLLETSGPVQAYNGIALPLHPGRENLFIAQGTSENFQNAAWASNQYWVIFFRKSILYTKQLKDQPVPVAALSRVWKCSRSLSGIAGSNPTGGMDVFLL